LIYHVSYFDWRWVEALFGGAKPTKTLRGDGTASQQFRNYSQTYLTLNSSLLIV